MMIRHECSYLGTKIDYNYEQEEYRHHQSSPMWSSPFGKCRVIRIQVFSLEECKSSYDRDEKESEYAWLWDSSDKFRGSLGESLLEHLKGGEEDDEESCPLDAREPDEESSYPIRCYDHEYDRDDETDHEVDDIAMACSSYREYIVQWHDHISDDDHLECFEERVCISSMLTVVLTGADLTVELPYDVEKQDCTKEFQSRDLEEEYHSEWEDDTEYGRTCYSPEYSFPSEFGRKLLGRHTDEDSIVPTHDDVDEDDIEESEESCTGCKCGKVSWERFKHKLESKDICILWNFLKMQFFWHLRRECGRLMVDFN